MLVASFVFFSINEVVLVHLRQHGQLFMTAIVLSWLIFCSFCYTEVTWTTHNQLHNQFKCRLNIATFIAVMLAGLVKFVSLILFILFSSHIRPNFDYDLSFYLYLACMIGDLLFASFLVRSDNKLDFCLNQYYEDKSTIESNVHAISM